jgi:hypothetical protein
MSKKPIHGVDRTSHQRDGGQPNACDSLPLIDEQAIDIDADPWLTWRSLHELLEQSRKSKGRKLVARVVGCDAAHGNSASLQAVGATLPGFSVAVVDAPARLDLAGSHHWARYCLSYRLEELRSGETRLVAQTRAEFPGLSGDVFQAIVIGTRLHVVAVRAAMRSVKDQAESSREPFAEAATRA